MQLRCALSVFLFAVSEKEADTSAEPHEETGDHLNMPLMAAPQKSCILLLDPSREHASRIPLDICEILERGFALLEEAAQILKIPRYFARPESRPTPGSGWFQTPCERNRKRVYDWPDDGTPWSNGDLITSIHGENRHNLYVCGFWLDDAVTFAALNALADGYDTYLLVDVSAARFPETREVCIERLIQAGVVPTTTLQITAEWMAQAHDTGMKARLSDLISRSLS